MDDGGIEARAGARLLFDAVGGAVGVVQDMHHAIARRVFGQQSTPASRLHQNLSAAVYSGINVGLAVGKSIVDTVIDSSVTLPPNQVSRRIGAALNGMVGDRLANAYPTLAFPMRLRAADADLDPTPAALAKHYPAASGHVVVFVHGLMETDHWWRHQEPQPGFGTRLSRDVGATALYVRYNTGRHISDNGAALAALLTETVDAWPVPVHRLSLVGHSMGGLVARSAVHQAVANGQPWLTPLREVICLGSPHQGSRIERGANLAAWVLRGFAESAPLALLAAQRSAGIKDLRYGYLDAADWTGHDPEALGRSPRAVDYSLAPQGRQRFLAGTVASDPDSVYARVVGDLVVSLANATDRSQAADRHTLGGISHFALLHHPTVYLQLRDWLSD